MRKALSFVVVAVAILGFAAGALAAAPGQSTFEKLAAIRADLVGVKSELGMYSCCINPSCSFCALATGMCPCGDGAANGEGVCGECLLGWQAGQGNIPGVNADDVNPMSGDMLQMMYEARAESMPGGMADAGATSDAPHHHAH